jgi:hypothetical protein
MIQAKLINSDAELNDFFLLEAVEFIPGQNLTLAVQLFNSQLNVRYIPPSAATMTMSFIDSSGNAFVKTATVIDANDRSMWSVALSQVETSTLAGQNIIVTLDVNGDGTVIFKALVENGVIRINLSGDC